MDEDSHHLGWEGMRFPFLALCRKFLEFTNSEQILQQVMVIKLLVSQTHLRPHFDFQLIFKAKGQIDHMTSV